jgi:hypothetical protein
LFGRLRAHACSESGGRKNGGDSIHVCTRDSASKARSANSRVYLSDSPSVKCSI